MALTCQGYGEVDDIIYSNDEAIKFHTFFKVDGTTSGAN